MTMIRWAVLSAISVAALGCNKEHAAPETHNAMASAAKNAAVAHHAKPTHWAYDGEGGPAHWAEISPEFSTCKTGRMQAPIDLRTSSARGRLLPIAFNYVPVPLIVRNHQHTVEAINSTRSTIFTGNGRHDRYELVSYDFHSPSEHAVDGKLSDMEMHLVHKNGEGKLAVVALLFRAGAENEVLAPVFESAPLEPSKKVTRVAGTVIDLPNLVPQSGAYFTYTGSLTTPPCTEGVSWYVMSTTLEASIEQIEQFVEITHGATNRPLQALNGRRVLQFMP